MRDTPKEHQSTALPIRSWMEEQQQKMTTRKVLEKCIPYVLKGITALSIFTTLLIIITLLTETITFFKHVPFLDFFTGTILKPLSQRSEERRVGKECRCEWRTNHQTTTRREA